MKKVNVGRGTELVINDNNHIEIGARGDIVLVSNGRIYSFSNLENLIESLDTTKARAIPVLKGKNIPVIEKVMTICYDTKRVWDSREEAMKHFLECMNYSEGSERDRYVNIYTKLAEGMMICSDEDY